MLQKHFRISRKTHSWIVRSRNLPFGRNPNNLPDWVTLVWVQGANSRKSEKRFVKHAMKYVLEKACKEPINYVKNSPFQNMALYAGVSGAVSQTNNLILMHLNKKSKEQDVLLSALSKQMAPKNTTDAHFLLENTLLLAKRQKEINAAYRAFTHPPLMRVILEMIFMVPIRQSVNNPYLSSPSQLSDKTVDLVQECCQDYVNLRHYGLPEVKKNLKPLKHYARQGIPFLKRLGFLKGEWTLMGITMSSGGPRTLKPDSVPAVPQNLDDSIPLPEQGNGDRVYDELEKIIRERKQKKINQETGRNVTTTIPSAFIRTKVILVVSKQLSGRTIIHLKIAKQELFWLQWRVIQLLQNILLSYMLFVYLCAIFLMCWDRLRPLLPKPLQLYLLGLWEKFYQLFDFLLDWFLNLILFPSSCITFCITLITLSIKVIVLKPLSNSKNILSPKALILTKKVEQEILDKNPFMKCLSYLRFAQPLDNTHFYAI